MSGTGGGDDKFSVRFRAKKLPMPRRGVSLAATNQIIYEQST
jgi:hypothetical protein